MSYPKDLDDYEEIALHAELARRRDLRAKGLCDYCGRSTQPPCKFPNRHPSAGKVVHMLKEGRALCTAFRAVPVKDWPTGHYWVGVGGRVGDESHRVTCEDCLDSLTRLAKSRGEKFVT